MRYIDMKILCNGIVHGASRADGEFARLAARIYVTGAAERKAQELAGLRVPVAFVPVRLDATEAWALIREDVFDAAVQQELRQRQEVAIAQSSGHVPIGDDDDGVRDNEAGAVCGGGGSGQAVQQEL